MENIPPDWNNDRKLWDALGRLTPQNPPFNFAHMVHQKISQKGREASRPSIPGGWFHLFRGWGWMGVSLASCLLMGILVVGYLMHGASSPVKNSPSISFAKVENPPPENVASTNSAEESSQGTDAATGVETAQLAENYDLLQDFDVIENLDKMM